ncbi:related to 3-ketoacyl-acyl carrier protein reductase [Cephalotrichum gorgonifer]|uniref:Related to 3-ketoacyl-acyl carrier protein reductase n=1 Tax=Cephalotrichum gorgonifer TaxID=2041049 RepID=A0AAE8MWC8_9PEZI|nr:related to 3-ketoacyl-acyl carrier protein reductase [Cephalotrichum gorgonifer]
MSSSDSLVVIVTGAAGGLGKMIAKTFLASGASVAICDVSAERLASTSAEWEALHAGKFLASKTDITDEDAVTAFVSAVVEKFGKVDVLVNNAGIMDTFDPAGQTAKSMWDKVMAVNATGTFLMSKAAVNVMLPAGGGTIISIGSVASYKGGAAGAAYTASKHAVAGLSKNLAGFYGNKGINSVVLYIGGMEETNIAAAFAVNPPNMEGMGRMRELTGYVQGESNVPLTTVAKYCLFLSDREVAAAANGGEVTVNKNWPAA